MRKKWVGLFISIVLFCSGSLSPLSLLKAAPESTIVRIQISHPGIVETLFEQSFSLVEMYESFVLVKADSDQIQRLEALSIPYQVEEDTHLLRVGSHTFFAEPDKSISSRDSSPEAVKSTLHVLQWIAPEKQAWQETLQSWGVTFLVPVYKNAWIIEVNPLFVSELRNFRFVQALQALPNCTRQNLDFSHIQSEEMDVEITFPSTEASQEWLTRKGYNPASLISEANPLVTVHLSDFPVADIPSLFLEPGVITVTEKQQPVLLNAEASQVLNIRDPLDQNIIQGLEGEGEIVGFADTGLSTGNPSTIHAAFTMPTFADKVVATFPAGDWRDYYGHGTHVAGSIVGTGAGDTVPANGIRYQGMAPKAKVVAQSVWSSYGNNTMYQILSDAYASGARIHSNSWSDSNDSWGQYDNSVYLIDQFHWDHMDFQGLFAVGNSRSYSQYGIWPPPNNGTYSLTNFSASKNGIGVGASQSLKPGYDPEVMAYFSSEGPTADERIKPEIVSPGNYVRSTRNTGGYTTMSGTSMATPVTAGSLVLVREHIRKNLHVPPQNISAALMKALLLHGANASILKDYSSYGGESLYLSETNYVSGWGRNDIRNALFPSGQVLKVYNEYSPDGTKGISNENRVMKYYIEVLDPSKPLKATLVWTDFPGTPCASIRPYDFYDNTPELVNNLDLTINQWENPNQYYGNRFNTTGQSIVNPSSHDSLNNVETILIPTPETGIYEITVSALSGQIISDLPHGYRQPYAMVITGGNIHTVFPPKEPFNLKAHTECGAITLKWQAPALDQYPVKEFLLHRIALTGFNAGEHVTFTVPATQKVYIDTTITVGIEYWYYVQAVNTKGLVSADSNGALGGYTPPPDPPHPYESPQVSSDRVFWYWNMPDPGFCPIDCYKVFRSTDPNELGYKIAQPDVTAHSYIDTDVLPGMTYYYTFYSVDIVPQTSAPFKSIAITIPIPEEKLALSVEPSVREICANRSFFLTIGLNNQSIDTAKDLYAIILPDPAFTILRLEGVTGIRQADGSWKVFLPTIQPNHIQKFQVNVQSNQSVSQEKAYPIVVSVIQDTLTVLEEIVNILVKPCSSGQPGNFYGRVTLNGMKSDPETGKKYLNKGDTLTTVLQMINGYAPYQALITWGDGEKTEMDNLEKNEFTFDHRYDSTGTMEMVIKITDKHGKQFHATIPIQVK